MAGQVFVTEGYLGQPYYVSHAGLGTDVFVGLQDVLCTDILTHLLFVIKFTHARLSIEYLNLPSKPSRLRAVLLCVTLLSTLILTVGRARVAGTIFLKAHFVQVHGLVLLALMGPVAAQCFSRYYALALIFGHLHSLFLVLVGLIIRHGHLGHAFAQLFELAPLRLDGCARLLVLLIWEEVGQRVRGLLASFLDVSLHLVQEILHVAISVEFGNGDLFPGK